MNEMLTRVKDAMQNAFNQQRIDPWHRINLTTVIPPVDWESIVRPVIAAMREPTEDMLEVVKYDSHGWAANNWRAMIDAALK